MNKLLQDLKAEAKYKIKKIKNHETHDKITVIGNTGHQIL